ncbi:MAG: hypothetical protein ACYC6Y_28670 [Thermoguttaceae bacterium]
MEQKRKDEIGRALEDVLLEGERIVADREGGLVRVHSIEEAGFRPLAEEKPELYGHLAAVSEILSDAGSNFVLFPMITVATICLAIHMRWIDTILGIEVDKLRSIWFYALVLAACFFFCGQVALWVEAFVYRRYRTDVVRAIREAGFSRWYLLARISQDKDLSNIVDKLKTGWREWSETGFGR